MTALPDQARYQDCDWNFNPDTIKYRVHNGLALKTAMITDSLLSANNKKKHASHL